FGCQMNVRDSEVICGLLLKEGYELTDNLLNADVIIFNTCSVRQHAEDRVFSLIGEYAKKWTKGSLGKRGHQEYTPRVLPLIGLVGCMAKNYAQGIFEKAPQVDFVVGPSDIDKIPGIIRKLLLSKKIGTVPYGDCSYFESKIWETNAEVRPEEIYHTGFYENKNHAYVVISEGCSNFCSYCVVPYVRGLIRHRSHKEILKEIRLALEKGITSFTLLGQNVNAYKDTGIDFIKLLELVNNLKGLKELTFMTSHPKDASVSLFKTIAGLDRVKKSLHLPLQSGSERILKLMNRGYTAKNYLDLVNNYRKIVKGGKISTDIIVGFPTENEADFKDTFSLFKKVKFNSAFIFKYSPRPKTEAFKMQDGVLKEEKEKRHSLMLKLQKSVLMAVCFIFFFSGNALALNIDKIKVSFLSGNYRAAISEANRLISQDRYSSELYYFLGLSYLKEGEYQKAADSFRAVINNFKETRFKEEARIGLADTYFLRGDFANAGSIYRELLAENPRIKFKDQIKERLSRIEPKREDYYSVQVGSFSNADNAKNLARKLINSGYLAYIEEIGSLANRAYRVRVGRLNTVREAEDLGRKLANQGYPTKICP
ncbi:MAG: MiaB/RimO family radical SAM methylthiotransferase, partial [Candidatus Omnitrophica bacterium]|nr:MiaB/RimO family radical SAM methylthiotransferase [Candidatus Omnitrophota bacterium]